MSEKIYSCGRGFNIKYVFSVCCSEQGILQTFSGTESDVIYPEVKEFLKKVLQ